MLNPYFLKLSLRKEISIGLFLTFLINFSCDVFTFLLRSTAITWDSLVYFVLGPLS